MRSEVTEQNSGGIAEFLLIATIVSLVCALVFFFSPSIEDSFFGLPLFGLQAIAPSLATVIMVTRRHSAKGLKAFLKEKYLTDISVKLCLLAFAIPLTILLLSKAMVVVFRVGEFTLIAPNAARTLIIAWALIAEELGWRGFLQERVERKAGMIFTPLIIGIIWGTWHFHYYLSGSMGAPFTLLILGCVFESYGYFVITKLAKGNIMPASVWHFSGNLFINVMGFNESNISYLIMTLTYGICVFGFIIYYNRQVKRK